jgi:catechol 2,3-dioxygenase-like lactoylglutathione lyase family enzyme
VRADRKGAIDMALGQSGTPVAFVYTSDRQRALDFYCTTLGLEHRDGDGYGDWIALEGALLRLTVIPDHQASPHPVFGWEVADARAAVEALKAKGVDCIVYEGFGQDELGIWTSPDGTQKLAWFADPDGNALMISQT